MAKDQSLGDRELTLRSIMAESKSNTPDLQELVLLNQEIAALVRAGIPLESSLAAAGQPVDGVPDTLMLRLAIRLREGMPLADALHAEGRELPGLYRAVVAAGVRTGRLPEALEALARFSQETLQLRRRIDLALLYPGLVLLMSGVLLAWVIAYWVPRLSEAFASLRVPATAWLRWLEWLEQHFWAWAWVVPSMVFGAAVWWWCSSRGRYGLKGVTESSGWSAFRRLPGVRSILANFRRANFCDLMALLLDHRVTLPEAALLAAEATGDRALQRVASRIADGVRAGHSLADCLAVSRDLPPFVSWMLICGDRQGNLVHTLRQVSTVMRQRAASQSDWLRVLLPTFLIVVLGGSAVLLYALTVFWPMSQLLKELGEFHA
jgi:general secretion pathway protein F